MRSSWPIPLGVALVGALAGVAIAGQPDQVDTLVIDASAETSPETSTSTLPETLPAVSSTAVSVTTVGDSVVVTTTTLPATVPSTVPASTVPASTSSSVAQGTVARADVRVVVANGDGRFNLAGRNGTRLEQAGYVQIDLEDASKVDATVLYYRPGFDDEALIMAADLLVPNAILAPLPEPPDPPVTSNDSLGDIVVVLGPDAQR